MRYSFVVPLYNRAEGLCRLLDSFLAYGPKEQDYEIIVVEDGSSKRAEDKIPIYQSRLPLRYLLQANNLGPAAARNLGSKQARGQYLVFVDSDTALTPRYFVCLEKALGTRQEVVFGGGTEALPRDSSLLQQAIHYSMSARLSTGGIRGRTQSMESFKPRTHNMVLRSDIFAQVGGFNAKLRYGEDVDLSIRLERAGYRAKLLREVEVFHYRKDNLGSFFEQVYQSGRARVALGRLHRRSTQFVHLLPLFFLITTLGSLLLLGLGVYLPLGAVLVYALALAVETICSARSLYLGLAAVGLAFVQLGGYGLGYLLARLGL